MVYKVVFKSLSFDLFGGEVSGELVYDRTYDFKVCELVTTSMMTLIGTHKKSIRKDALSFTPSR